MSARTLMDGTCPSCHTHYTGILPRDEGIGAYEYWGAIGVHHDWRYVCAECDCDLIDLEPSLQEPYDV